MQSHFEIEQLAEEGSTNLWWMVYVWKRHRKHKLFFFCILCCCCCCIDQWLINWATCSYAFYEVKWVTPRTLKDVLLGWRERTEQNQKEGIGDGTYLVVFVEGKNFKMLWREKEVYARTQKYKLNFNIFYLV